MCVIVLALDADSDYPVVILNGRDYSFERPTSDAKFHVDSKLIAGIDLKAGGTWCGINTETGSFAAVTDFREAEKSLKATSRGIIVRNYLTGTPTNEKDDWAGFNCVHGFVFGKKPKMFFTSNRNSVDESKDQWQTTEIGAGVYALSNGFWNDCSWPKVKYLQNNMQSLLNEKKSTGKYSEPPQKPALTAEEFMKTEIFQQFLALLDATPNLPPETHPVFKTHLAPQIEGFLQKDVFLNLSEFKYGTRAQTMVIKSKAAKSIFYFYRNTDNGIRKEWSCWTIPDLDV